MLIRAYGQFWNPDIVEWGTRGPGNRGKLSGNGKWGKQKIQIDSWEQHGIYILHHDFKAVYVGQVFDLPLGKRLRDHLTDRFAGRWDMFSWYGIDTVKKDGSLREAGTRQISPELLVNTIEALGILLADPPLNRKRESLDRAIYVEQSKSPHPRTVRSYLQKIVERLDRLHSYPTIAKKRK